MEKRKVNGQSRLTGILIGVILTFCVLTLAVSSVITNNDFWMKQNDRYGLKDKLELVSNDGFRTVYYGYINLINGKDEQVFATVQGEPEDYAPTFTEKEITVNGENGQYQLDAELDGKFIYTVKELEKSKDAFIPEGDGTDFLNKKMCVEIIVPGADKAFEGISISDITVKDNTGKVLQLDYCTVTVEKDGSVIEKDMDEQEAVEFVPKSASTSFRAYISDGDDLSKLYLTFSSSAVKDECVVSVKLTYTDALTADEVAKRVGPRVQMLFDDEKAQVLAFGSMLKTCKIASVIAFALAVVLFVYACVRNKRNGLWGVGVYIIIASAVLMVIINLIANFMPENAAIFNFAAGSTSSVIISKDFIKDFTVGGARFFDFLMIAPLFIGYVLIKISKNKKDDPNEDYLYQ